jgi:phosphoglucosamine mutase
VLQNVKFSGADPLESAAAKSAMKAAETKLGATGRLVVRKSGTEPLIRVMAEGADEALVKAVVKELSAAIEKAKN